MHYKKKYLVVKGKLNQMKIYILSKALLISRCECKHNISCALRVIVILVLLIHGLKRCF